jgi:hypothetical protein
VIDENLPDLEEIWSVMNTLLESYDGNNAQRLKRKGASVIQAVVTPMSFWPERLTTTWNSEIDTRQ